MKKFKYILDEFYYCIKRAFAISFLLAFEFGLYNAYLCERDYSHYYNYKEEFFSFFYEFVEEFDESFVKIWECFISIYIFIYILITLSIFISKWWKKRKTINK